MSTNNFKPFAIGPGANVTSQSDYESLAALSSGFTSGKASSAQINKALRQSSVITSSLAQFVSDSTQKNMLDDGNVSSIVQAISDAIKAASKSAMLPLLTGVTGASINSRANITSPSSNMDYFADEVIVSTAIGGVQYRLPGISSRVSLSSTGAGGMDLGSAPVTGFVAIYVIYNPTSGSVSTLAVDATSLLAPEVYGGSNMPTGYTASALVAIWPTSSSQFVIGNLIGRKVEISARQLFSSSTVNASRVSLKTAQIPLNARLISGNMNFGSTAASNMSLVVWGANSSVGGMALTMSASANGAYTGAFSDVSVTNQTIGWSSANTAGTPTFSVGMGSYKF